MTQKPTKAFLAKLANLVSEYTQLDAVIKGQEVKRDSLKLDIVALVQPYADRFADGEWIILHPDAPTTRVGVIRQAKNKPALLVIDSDDKPTEKQLAALLLQIDATYLVRSPNVKAIMKAAQTNRPVQKLLKKLGLEVVQKTRFDVKP